MPGTPSANAGGVGRQGPLAFESSEPVAAVEREHRASPAAPNRRGQAAWPILVAVGAVAAVTVVALVIASRRDPTRAYD